MDKSEGHSIWLNYAGNVYEYIAGPKTGRRAKAVDWIIDKGSDKMLIVMSDGSKVPEKQFYDFMVVSTGMGQTQSQNASHKFASKKESSGDPSSGPSIEERAGIMSDEEEAEFLRRQQQKQNSGNSQNSNENKKDSEPDNSNNPVHLVLSSRKNKPVMKVTVDVELELLDKSTYDLVNGTFDDALDHVISYFEARVDKDKLSEDFKESLERFFIEEFAIEEDKIIKVQEDSTGKTKYQRQGWED